MTPPAHSRIFVKFVGKLVPSSANQRKERKKGEGKGIRKKERKKEKGKRERKKRKKGK